MEWKTIKVEFDGPICYIKFNRPNTKNAINNLLIEECHRAVSLCEKKSSVVIFEGSPQAFCFGADFNEVEFSGNSKTQRAHGPDLLYDLWLKMASGPFISISHVRGVANAGGIGFVAASDIVIADDTAVFSLSELLFGLFPAMVLPFLIRKIGYQKSNYLTLTTRPVNVQLAYELGLVDEYQKNSNGLLKRQLARVIKLPKSGIKQYKNYMMELNDFVFKSKKHAVETNQSIFSDSYNLERIRLFVEKGIYPWEGNDE
ncbi:enoyl-CoA hydratase/isomerase [Bacillus velezensis]|uniref:enoyl-CoA hydratase/isomerase n=1 Tax=Bacillus TaxID=1386 RepID=UPI0004585FE3|nr:MULTISPECIES: enoyl-CoA hydratase/isomerase [Bacillus]AIW36572.1 polyketide biosynthesis enoyl-CoA hydratase [Bacillus subtilis]AHZ14670.1 polyketide biosynthesis enoyl-CoA hydratase [Bacillus velezensis SQR9]AKF77510.1 polyketide biosynthesis enoyl-CoA hydratase [Bacillus velezensis]AWD13183.1 enoyl-CoA hydratase [Bacillus velezensis]MDH2303551.1 enoyl-CoA hydratase/isomerase [Bacillus velezensis]